MSKKKKKKSVYQKVRNPWKKSTEKVHDGNKEGKEEKRLEQEVDEYQLEGRGYWYGND